MLGIAHFLGFRLALATCMTNHWCYTYIAWPVSSHNAKGQVLSAQVRKAPVVAFCSSLHMTENFNSLTDIMHPHELAQHP